MKTIAGLVFALAILNCAHAQIRLEPHKWNATIKVVDDTGQPVPGAEVRIDFSAASNNYPVPDVIVGKTDKNGIFAKSHTDRTVQLWLTAQKDGYYKFEDEHWFGFDVKTNTDWNPSPTLILKRIRNPIPMYAKGIREIPVLNQPAGYDLMAGEWVAPNGKGVNADIIFTRTVNLISNSDAESKWIVSFPNKGDGIQVFELPLPVDKGSPTPITRKGSPLRSPYQAPEGGYLPTLTRESSAHPGQPSKFEFDPKRVYIFRVQTVLDEQGNVKSALYGKIYGDFFEPFGYCLNPKENDRNLEFDFKRNLIPGQQIVEVP